MPTVEENIEHWNSTYSWNDQEEEWSSSYPGGSKTMWFGLIFPRIHHFLPTDTILEIAPGMGRWTQYLKDLCHHLIVVDLSDKCIEACKKHFSACEHIEYHVNDGKSLQMVGDNTVDFVFSFDSLVHCEADVLDSYLTQLAGKLKHNGIGFIHHSNISAYSKLFKYFPKIILKFGGYRTSWRAQSVNAELFNKLCDKAGLRCFSQELVNWDTHGLLLVDSFSIFCRKDFAKGSKNQIIKNREFMSECYHVMKIAGAARQQVTRNRRKESAAESGSCNKTN